VQNAITEATHAHYHTYDNGGSKRHVIHVVGPELFGVEREEAVRLLTAAYSNVLQQFVSATTANSDLTTLRLLPISGGIFAGNWKDEMPKLTMEALTAAAGSLTEEQLETLKARKLELCIFMADDLQKFEDAKTAA